MKKEKASGYVVIELNHSGIPDEKLKPETFSPHQEAVLAALPPERQEAIRRGCPVIVADVGTRENVATFNMGNVSLSKYQVESLGRSLHETVQRFYSDPENERRFQEWKKKREEQGDA